MTMQVVFKSRYIFTAKLRNNILMRIVTLKYL